MASTPVPARHFQSLRKSGSRKASRHCFTINSISRTQV